MYATATQNTLLLGRLTYNRSTDLYQKSMPQPRTTSTRQEIVDAATRLLIEEGANGFSVRKVARYAKISLGNLQYHFPNKNHLVHALFDQVKDRVLAGAGTQQDEEGQLFAYIDAILAEWDTAEGSIPIWELGSLSAHDAELADMLYELYQPFRKHLSRFISSVDPQRSQKSCDHQATCIVAMIEGSGLFDAYSRSHRNEFRGMRKQLRATIRHIIFTPEVAA